MVFHFELKYIVIYIAHYFPKLSLCITRPHNWIIFTCLFYLSTICPYVCDPVGSHNVGIYIKSRMYYNKQYEQYLSTYHNYGCH